MADRQKLNWFIEDEFSAWTKRTIVGMVCIAVYLFGLKKANPFMRSLVESVIDNWETGPKYFLKHVFFYSLTNAVLCFGTFLVFAKLKMFRLPSLKRNVKSSLVKGFVAGLIITALTVIQVFLTKSQFHFNLDIWEITGNIFSNAYEEIIYRGLIFTGMLYLFRISWAAFIVSGLIFGWSHTQYNLFMQFGVGVVGVILSYLYYNTGNLLAPWTTHQVTDTIVDTILEM